MRLRNLKQWQLWALIILWQMAFFVVYLTALDTLVHFTFRKIGVLP